MFNVTTLTIFFGGLTLPATHFASINHINALRILNYTQNKILLLLLTALNCSLYTIRSFVLGRSAA